MRRPVVITSYNARTCLGDSPSQMLRQLRSGQPGLSLWSEGELPLSTYVGRVDVGEPLRGALGCYDSRLARLALSTLDVVVPAVEAAVKRWGAERVALVLGTSTAGLETTETAFASLQSEGCLPTWFSLALQHAFSAVVELVAKVTGSRGPAYALSAACASSSKVFASARRLLVADIADAVLVGGVDTLCMITLAGFHALGILSSEPCKPFAADREGINIGEGAAFMLLERNGEAPCALWGCAETCDAHHMSAPHPAGQGAFSCMNAALQAALIDPSEVDYVNAHGSATPQNDVAEAKAIARTLPGSVAVSSTKGLTGHLLGAAGAVEAVICLLALEHNMIPPSVGAVPIDPSIEATGINICTTAHQKRCRFTLSNSLAFGGSNASVLLGRTP